MTKNITNSTVKVISIIFVAIMIVLSMSGIITTVFFNNYYWDSNERVYFKIDNILLNIVFVCAFLLIIYFLNKILRNVNIKIVLAISLILIFSLSMWWILFSRVPLRADQNMINISAIEFTNKDYTKLDSGQYLFMHPLQLGMVYYLKIIYDVLHTTNYLVIRILNILYLCGSIILIEKISNRVLNYNQDLSKILYIMFLLFIPLIFFTTYVYGNLIGLFLSLIAIYLMFNYLDNKKILNMLLSAISIAVAIILKNNYLIFMIAMIIVIIIDTIKRFDYKNLIYIVLVLILYKAFNIVVLSYTENLIKKEVNDGVPMISYIDMAMAENSGRSAGWYNENRNVESIYIQNNYNIEQTKEDSKEAIKERIKFFLNNPKEFLLYYLEKIGSTWLEPTFQSIWINVPAEEINNINIEDKEYIQNNKLLISIYQGKVNSIIVKYLDVFQIVVYLTSGIYVLKNLKHIDYKNFIFILIFIGGFAFHILWETKSSYAISYFILLIPYACLGIRDIFNYIDIKLYNKQLDDK